MRAHAGCLVTTAAFAALLLAGIPGSARAQDAWDDWGPHGPASLSLGLSAGTYLTSDWSNLVVLGTLGSQGAFEQVLLRDVHLEPAPVLVASATYRRGRGGARVQFAYSHACLAIADACLASPPPGASADAAAERIHVNSWMLDVDAEISLLRPHRGQWFRPYVLLGGGGILYDPDGGAAQFLPRFIEADRADVTMNDAGGAVVSFRDNPAFVVSVAGLGMKTVFAGVLGAGTDICVPIGGGGVGLRLQAADHISASPLRIDVLSLRDGRFGHSHNPREPTPFDFGVVHNLRFTAGLVIDVGLPGQHRHQDGEWW